MTEHDTFTGWITRDRQVRKGERAQVYAINPDPDSSPQRAALFTLEQTDPYAPVNCLDWPRLAAADLPPKNTDKRPKLRLKLDAEGYVTVWCGPDRFMIDVLKRKHWVFDSKTAYWVAPHKDAQRTIEALTAHGYNVQEV